VPRTDLSALHRARLRCRAHRTVATIFRGRARARKIQLFREALTCFSNGAFNAFASMCRRAAQSMFADLGEAGKLRLFDELNAVRDLANIAPEIFTKMKSVLFGAELDARSALPQLDGYEAGIMLEVVKDLFYEAYVRKGKLQQAIMVRRFFLDETGSNVTPFISAS
jgi:hypothetical protein